MFQVTGYTHSNGQITLRIEGQIGGLIVCENIDVLEHLPGVIAELVKTIKRDEIPQVFRDAFKEK